jgi:AbrB family looped-hinge helix DNA binding protein
MHERKLYGTATVGTKGQIVIPADAREEMGINTGDRLYVIGSPKKGMAMLLKEDELDKFIEQMNFHIEAFKNIKKT